MYRRYFDNQFLRKAVLVGLDLFLLFVSGVIALKIRFEFMPSREYLTYRAVWQQHAYQYIGLTLLVFYLFGLYKSLWRYAGIYDMVSVVLASVIANILGFLFFTLWQVPMPRSFYILNTILIVALTGGLRFFYRAARRFRSRAGGRIVKKASARKNTLIVGAGDAGYLMSKELDKSLNLLYRPVGFLDDDPNKAGRRINGLRVLARIDQAAAVIEAYDVENVILAMPSTSKQRKREIFSLFKDLGVKLKTLPGIYELINGQVSVEQIRQVDIEDLLGRDPIVLNALQVGSYLQGKTVMITGGGGSIGSELCRQTAAFSPSKLLIFDIYENTAYDIQNELKASFPNIEVEVRIGSVRDKKRLEEIFKEFKPQIVFHAAAHKHVPLMEDSPFEAIQNNTFGACKVAQTAGEQGAEKFVLISTDKAVNPTNIMGASKRLAEIAVQAAGRHYPQTEFVCVRFGNVLGSNGSVIPLFKKQIERGGPLTITHPNIIRYFMTISEAVQLVLQAAAMAKSGQIFILDMGEPVKILQLAEDLIKLSGFEPYEDIAIEFTGLRPGEKLYEELLLSEEGLAKTPHPKIFVGQPLEIEEKVVKQGLEQIQQAVLDRKVDSLVSSIRALVPTYKSTIDTRRPRDGREH